MPDSGLMDGKLMPFPLPSELPDRRGNNRFPLQVDLRYRIVRTRLATEGSGKTLNMASSGILFTTQEPIPVGHLIELAVSWPARLSGSCALQLVASGRVVRSDSRRAAMVIQRYEFRTRRSVPA
jgi:hypothetical protein